MPLPDERPRQSVANLIGRFEQKRQSIPSAAPPRTSSGLSNPGGDAAKIEVKEKREWPPKPKQEKEPETKVVEPDATVPEEAPTRPSLPTPDASPKAETAPLPKSSPVVEQTPIPEDVSVTPPPPEEPAVIVPSSPTTKPVPTRQSSVGSVAPPASRPPATPSKPKAPVSRPSTVSKPLPARASGRSPPTSFHAPPHLPASSSIHSNVKASPSARLAHSSQAPRSRPSSSASLRPPTTPARPKSPSTARPKTPATAPRSKTPASGLFAPTAASLAKARHAQDDGPQVPVKKQPLTSDAAERLSKPTAASLSKARAAGAPANVARPSPAPRRGAAPATRGVAPSRGTAAAKTRGGATVAKAKAPAKAAPPPLPTESVSHEDVTPATRVGAELLEVHAEPAILHDEPEEVQEYHEDAALEQVASTETDAPHDDQVDPAAVQHAEDVVVEDHAHVEERSHEQHEQEIELPDSPSPNKQHNDHLQDLVSMLEGKPVQLGGHDDVVAEIPDIDEE